MRARARSALFVVALGGVMACTLVRSFDGFTDGEDADVPDTSTDVAIDGVVREDVVLPSVEGGADARPSVKCSLETMADYGGPARFDPGFVAGMAVSERSLFLAAGSQDAAAVSLGDAGQVVRVAKTPPYAVTVVGNALKQVYSCAPRDSGAVCGVGTKLVLFEQDGGRRELADLVDNIDDVYAGAGGTFALTRAQRDSGVVWLQRGLTDAAVAQPLVFPHRIRHQGNQILVSRIGAGYDAAISAFDESGWAAPDAALTGCNLVSDRAQFQFAVNSKWVYWLTTESDFRFAERRCGSTIDTIDGTFYSVAADERFVFLRTATEVRLVWADDVRTMACSVPLGAAAAPAPSVNNSTETAAFEGDDVYFLANPHVVKLHIEVGP